MQGRITRIWAIPKPPPEVFYRKKAFLKISQNSQKNTYARVSFLIKLQTHACNFIKKETLAQVFSCEFCKIFKKTFFTENFLKTASAIQKRFSLKMLSNVIVLEISLKGLKKTCEIWYCLYTSKVDFLYISL